MDASLYMDAVITPNRSLSERGFVVLIGVVTAFNCLAAAMFLSIGATLVPFFLGLDVIAVVAAFLVSFAAAKRVERVQVTSRDVRVVRETPRHSQVIWESPTAFTRVALSPDERQEFARALQRAIRQAREARS